ncbi:hypothetical protein LJC10_01620 [Selenomonadales bacterium OttesenSCG-928-I06]|nr:hypothetical protein [Selenomonadales bacterium OttesenSCG-928-I06]
MNTADYLRHIKRKLQNSFDFRDANNFPYLNLELFAEQKIVSEKYLFTKKLNIYQTKNHEFICIHIPSTSLSAESITSYTDIFKKYISKDLKISENHMSTIVTFVIITEENISPEVIKETEKAKYHKDFMLTLKGWADLAIILVDLKNKLIHSNKFGQKLIKNYNFDC